MEMNIEAQEAPGVEIDAERQQKAREFARIRRRLSIVGLAIAAIGGLVFVLWNGDFGLLDLLRSLTWQPISGWYPLQIAAYFLILIVGYQIITTPLSYYSSFVLSHRYGISTQSLRNWMLDLLKGFGIGLIFEIVAIEVIYLLLATQPQLWWLWVALAFLFFTVIMANLGPVLLLPLFYKFTPLPDGELKERLLRLTTNAHTSVRGVFTMHLGSKTTAANAAVMGLGNTRRIVVGDTMLDKYTPDEIEVVLAHELGHHVHRDLWKLIISQSVITLAAFLLVNLVLHWVVDSQHYYLGLADPAGIPFVLLLIGIFGLIFMPISNGYSRYIEYQADEYALQSTKKVEAFKSAMTRLANQNLSDVEPAPLVEFLFYDHPAIGKRLKHAEQFAAHDAA